MAAFHRILLLFSAALVSVAARQSHRTKRGIIELAETVECSTGKSALDYAMYGCYCGQGGQGWPRDETDWCCFRHDCCYGEAERLGCLPKREPYHWTCKDHTPECDDQEEDICKKLLCKCDTAIAECLKKAPYNLLNAAWLDIFCLEEKPPCDYES